MRRGDVNSTWLVKSSLTLNHKLVGVGGARVEAGVRTAGEDTRDGVECEVAVSRGREQLVGDGGAGAAGRFPGSQGARQTKVLVGTPRPVHHTWEEREEEKGKLLGKYYCCCCCCRGVDETM